MCCSYLLCASNRFHLLHLTHESIGHVGHQFDVCEIGWVYLKVQPYKYNFVWSHNQILGTEEHLFDVVDVFRRWGWHTRFPGIICTCEMPVPSLWVGQLLRKQCVHRNDVFNTCWSVERMDRRFTLRIFLHNSDIGLMKTFSQTCHRAAPAG